jgi:hypothetical protein
MLRVFQLYASYNAGSTDISIIVPSATLTLLSSRILLRQASSKESAIVCFVFQFTNTVCFPEGYPAAA